MLIGKHVYVQLFSQMIVTSSEQRQVEKITGGIGEGEKRAEKGLEFVRTKRFCF